MRLESFPDSRRYGRGRSLMCLHRGSLIEAGIEVLAACGWTPAPHNMLQRTQSIYLWRCRRDYQSNPNFEFRLGPLSALYTTHVSRCKQRTGICLGSIRDLKGKKANIKSLHIKGRPDAVEATLYSSCVLLTAVLVNFLCSSKTRITLI